MFKELEKVKTSEVEKSISEKWEKMHILDKCIEKNDKYFVFYDGPATANGFPGLHHMVAKFLKDSFCKYKTMQGYKVLRKVGWDTHGLPVEVEVEKTLGFKNKTDIEKYGIKEFNEKCREIVWKNEKAFSDLTTKMGQFVDLKHPYVTYDNNYIETEWYILKKFFEEGLFYEGVKIVPYCTRCGTGLASHEVAQGYKEVEAQTVIVPMKKKDEDAYFLVWTTTPWTLIANVALCVNPDEDYVKVLSKGYKFILGKNLLSKVLGDEYEILEEYKGKDLEYMEYEQLIPSLNIPGKAFYVTVDNYVTMEDGTGIVHLAPAFGEDDSKVGKKYHLPYVNPVGEDGKYTDGLWKGMNVFEADLEVIKYLKANDKLFKKQKMVHNYPHCWRCGTPLLYYSKPSFYLEVTKLKDKIVEANKHVNWYPEYVGEKRFGNWLENLNDWAISRSRYWGTPLPLWRCECGNQEMIGSRKELVEKSIEEIDETIELHRPYVDDIHIKCPKCGKTMNRVKDVIDCWFDSGSMPFAQYHYPFENMELWQTQFPADFISEGIDQTRGWFYSLIVISVFLKGVAPYKNVLVNDLLLDKEGKKMSKSKGNIVEPFSTIEKYGADTVRFYLPYVSPVWTPLKFDEEGLKEVYSKFFNPLLNTYTFFQTYANIDSVDPREFEVKYEDLEEIDKWLLSKYNKLLKYVTNSYEEYDLNKVVRALVVFVSDDLSNWYIRRNRNRFWASKLDNSKKAVYKTTYNVLVGLSKMIAPIVPFVSENLYTKLTYEESVHLADFPKYDDDLIDLKLEEKMDTVRDLISLGRKIREDVKIKVREPLSEVILDMKQEKLIGDLTTLIEEELNVKQVIFTNEIDSYINFEIKPNFKVCGKLFGSNIKLLSEYLQNLDKETIKRLENDEVITITLNDTNYDLDKEMLDIRVNSKEGYNSGVINNSFIILNTTLTDDLINEGIARELISKVQNLRKVKDFNITDRIYIYYYADINLLEKLDKYIDFIKKETLSDSLIFEKTTDDITNLNGIDVYLDVKRV
ncbi:MAG: isoleucine--tRNA ligase [Erysipelotrichaceae bacterium]|nr:isoleucine--tRNA ligase [Erysipelotrichaceae bacterium]